MHKNKSFFCILLFMLNFLYAESIDINLPRILSENIKDGKTIQLKIKDKFIENFKKFSEYKIVDSGKLSETLKRQKESFDAYSGNELETGNIISADYYVDINIYFDNGKYNLSARITDSRTNEIKGTSSKDYQSYSDFIDRASGEATYSLLTSMGVKLTNEDRYYLYGGKSADETYLEKPEEVRKAERAKKRAIRNSKEYQLDFPRDTIKLDGGIFLSPNYKCWEVSAFADFFWLFENPLGLEFGPKYMLTNSFEQNFWVSSILMQLKYSKKMFDKLAVYGLASCGVSILKTGEMSGSKKSEYDVNGEDESKTGVGAQLGFGIDFAFSKFAKLYCEYSFNYLSPAIGTGDIIAIGIAFGPRK